MVTIRTRLIHKLDRQDIMVNVSSILTMSTKFNTMTEKFTDYPADQIQAKLKQIDEFEAKYGPKARSKSWRKWCTDYNYRKQEWQFRQNLAKSMDLNKVY